MEINNLIESFAEFKEQKSEVAGTVWKSVNKELFEKLAFESAKKALTKWTEEKVK